MPEMLLGITFTYHSKGTRLLMILGFNQVGGHQQLHGTDVKRTSKEHEANLDVASSSTLEKVIRSALTF